MKPYGICWTRNEASESHPAINLGNLLRSATSARRASEGKIPLCLFTNLEETTIMNEAFTKYGNESNHLFDVSLQDSLATYIPKTGAEALLLWPTTQYKVIRSRVGRLLNLARAPYEMTLFVDDDTYFCAPHGPDGLLNSIKWLHDTRERHTLRAQVFGHNGGGKECIWHQVLHENASFSAASRRRLQRPWIAKQMPRGTGHPGRRPRRDAQRHANEIGRRVGVHFPLRAYLCFGPQ